MKKCNRCGVDQALSEFYTRSPGVLRRDCKTCVKLRVVRYRIANLSKVHASDRARRAPDKRKRKTTPHQHVRNRFKRQVASGKIVPPLECSECAKQCRPEGHHSDYDKPFDVTWLCATCHGAQHRKYDYDKIIKEMNDDSKEND